MLKRVFFLFNVFDIVLSDYDVRFMVIGDVILIDEGRKGKIYYKLFFVGWRKINCLIV